MTVTSPANPLVKEVRGLALKKNRESSRRFLAEGLKLVTDALDQGWPVNCMLYLSGAEPRKRIEEMAVRARARGATIVEASEKVLAAISRRDNPQTVIGVFGQRWIGHGEITSEGEPLWIALDRVRDPGNLGTIIRTADAVGAAGVILIGETTDPFALEAVRATMGSIFAIPLCQMSTDEFLDWRARWPGLVIGTHLDGAEDFRDIGYSGRPVLLLMGNEQRGLPEVLAQACDRLCLIPMAGAADSLNLAVATGIMAFEIRRHLLAMPERQNK